MTGYELSRGWFDWCFENTEKINPNHTALYFYIIEHCNRLGWKESFGLPMEMAKEAIGIKNYRTYAKTFQDLIDFGFIKLIQKSKNQYSANVIAIVKNTEANTKALDKAMQKQSQSIVGINKPINHEPINIEHVCVENKNFDTTNTPLLKFKNEVFNSRFINKYATSELNLFFEYWTQPTNDKFRFQLESNFDLTNRLGVWCRKNPIYYKAEFLKQKSLQLEN